MTNDTTIETATEYLLRDADGSEQIINAADLSDAQEQARDWARGGDWNLISEDSTIWVTVDVSRTIVDGDGDEAWEHAATVTVAIDPPEPECCVGGAEHDWQSPHALVGGLEENPGVRANGGGVIVIECCMRCGCQRTTDTWAQDPSSGRQGLTSVSYELGAYELPWIYDDEHVVSGEEIAAAEEAGACEEAIEWLRANEGGITVADVRAHKLGWYQWAVRYLGVG